jgi:hypothetical protein
MRFRNYEHQTSSTTPSSQLNDTVIRLCSLLRSRRFVDWRIYNILYVLCLHHGVKKKGNWQETIENYSEIEAKQPVESQRPKATVASQPTTKDQATSGRAVNQLIDYQLIAILIDYFNYQFNYLKPTSISISISCHWRPIELSTN